MRRKALKAAFPCTIPIFTGFFYDSNHGGNRASAYTFPEKIRTCEDLTYDNYTTDYHDRLIYRRNDAHALPAFCHL